MVNWKNPESTDRLIAVLLAAHPSLKLDYRAMALIFSQGATFDSIEGRFRRYRKMADELKDEAYSRGIVDIPRNVGRTPSGSAASTPRTPRGPRGGITKRTPSSSRNKKDPHQAQSPTKKKKPGLSVMDAIYIDDVASEEELKVKAELTGGGGEVVGSPCVSLSGSASPGMKVKRERGGGRMAGFSSGIMAGFKKEEEMESVFGAGAMSTMKNGRPASDGVALYSTEMDEDPFVNGGYFDQSFTGYDVNDVYGEAA
ncbi:hypothetical protein BDV28DRAFT_144950 [Aspergillus coremiiformis]|uniref:Uncharacterized protein n=1 Tax=Aspergillus coremiiformis TaxID=138285 RepID=A0A5N6ZGL5_9EURO|nr:hypothetical protein BDV28DRAFT_144950 [Aspergillus coremiiformis]